jgi:ClpP class serine protease
MTAREQAIEKRLKLIKDLEGERKSRIICYFLGDRQGYPQGVVPDLATMIASDAIRPFYEHLEGIGYQDRIDLFLYSRGGDTNVPLRLVRLIREHCKYFSVLVPFRAHSAATMICLGADEIVMGKMGEISPVDPTTVNVFNPIDPLNPAGRWPISVEDLTAYFTLARETAKLDTEESTQGIFKALTDKVNPIALGNVHRTYKLIRILVPKLLGLHMDSTQVKNKEKIEKIAEILTETLYTHSYPISRREARDVIGLNVVEPPQNVEAFLWSLYKQYELDLQLLQPFDPAQILRQSGQQSANFSEETGVIESGVRTHSFMQEGEILPPPTLEQIQQMLQVIPAQLLVQMIPQLVQLAQSLSLNPPAVKFTSQQWR